MSSEQTRFFINFTYKIYSNEYERMNITNSHNGEL